ncbi:hypothetical protein B7463_g477, partial [Scytalidium lignicola]
MHPSDVTSITAFAALSTLAAILEQIHYATSFRIIKQAEYENALKSLKTPAYGYYNSPQMVDAVLFWIQFYCYDVMALNILFWSITLFCGAWGIHAIWLGSWRDRANLSSKIFSVIFPGIVIGIANSPSVFNIPGLFLFFRDITVLSSLFGGSILLVLILYKYLCTRRLLARNVKRSGWWAPMGSKGRDNRDVGADGTVTSSVPSSTQIRIYDHALVTRFTIGFVVLGAFNAVIIILPVFDLKSNRQLAHMPGPDYSLSKTISDLLLFLPGVTSSLAIFLIFGTAKSWRQYRDMVLNCVRVNRRVNGSKEWFVEVVRNPRPSDSDLEEYPGPILDGVQMDNLEPVDQIRAVEPQAKLNLQDSLSHNQLDVKIVANAGGNHQHRSPKFPTSPAVAITTNRYGSALGDSDPPCLDSEVQAFANPVVQSGLQDYQKMKLERERRYLQRNRQQQYGVVVMPDPTSQNVLRNFLDDSSD